MFVSNPSELPLSLSSPFFLPLLLWAASSLAACSLSVSDLPQTCSKLGPPLHFFFWSAGVLLHLHVFVHIESQREREIEKWFCNVVEPKRLAPFSKYSQWKDHDPLWTSPTAARSYEWSTLWNRIFQNVKPPEINKIQQSNTPLWPPTGKSRARRQSNSNDIEQVNECE